MRRLNMLQSWHGYLEICFPEPIVAAGLLALLVSWSLSKGKPWQDLPAFWLVLGFWAFFFRTSTSSGTGMRLEVGRHAIQASVQLRLALWLLLFLALDTIVTNGYGIRTRHRS